MYVAASRRIARSTGRRSIEFGSTPSELRQLILITACGMVAFAALGAVSILTADGSSVLAAISFSVAAMGALAMSRFISLRSAVRRSSGLMHPGEVALAMCIGQGETFLTSAVVLATDRRILGLQAGLLRSPEMVASLAYSEVDTVDGGVDHVDIRGENSRVSITKGMPQQVNEFVKVLNAQLAAGGSDSTSFRI
jgi:hypothetical protein